MGAIRTGGQGSVYKGRRVGEMITAIKLLPTPIFTHDENDKHYRDFINEVKKLQRVNEDPNPNVVKILSYGVTETGSFPFIEMEFIDGPDLSELLQPPYEPVFSVKEVIKVAEQLSNALAHCHKLDVKHGDIKSNNVKYNKNTGNYVLLDFGLAILSDEERRTSLRHAGAIEFMAPEQNEGQMLFQTDVYAFGIILFELLAGKVPFPLDGNTETARNKVMLAHLEAPPPDILSLRASALPTHWSDEKKALEMQVPEWLIRLIYRCLEKDPKNRVRDGLWLHDIVLLDCFYTPEVAGLVKNNDQRWQAAVTQKDRELQDLKGVFARQEKELQMERQKEHSNSPPPFVAEKTTISKAAFNTLLLLLILVSGLAIYGLFFNNANDQSLADNNAISMNNGESNRANSETKRTVSEPVAEKKSSPAKDTGTRQKDVSAPKVPTKKLATETDIASAEGTTGINREEVEDEQPVVKSKNKEEEGVLYKVRNKAYFHNEPDPATRRNAFIVHWNKAVLQPLEERNEFVYIVFTNHLGQVSRGWLSKDDLIAIK